jgi:DNA invertase Pin-like site-specific DNA recombinase
MNPDTKIKYFIYGRKSSESDERQVQSIEEQVLIMDGIRKSYGLKVVDTLTEAKSAKEPHGRKTFEEMLARIEKGEAQGILVWKIDRLSRNPIDSARIQWLLQKETILSIRTPDREYRPEDNALLLSVESSMANQYIRDLSKNVKRGLKSKLDKGWMPGTAPLGYLNTKTEIRGENYIIKDPDRFPLIRKAWDLMLTGNYVPDQILDKLNNEWGFRTRGWKKKGGKPMSRSTIYRIFTNPFYAGIIPYKDLFVEGKHPAMVTIEEFDRVQFLLGRKGRPRPKRYEYAYTGQVLCGECTGIISATTTA